MFVRGLLPFSHSRVAEDLYLSLSPFLAILCVGFWKTMASRSNAGGFDAFYLRKRLRDHWLGTDISAIKQAVEFLISSRMIGKL